MFSDDDSALQSTSPDLGSIQFLLYSADRIIKINDPSDKFLEPESEHPIHEKASKAFAHRVGFVDQAGGSGVPDTQF
jgi:hypothetical protein